MGYVEGSRQGFYSILSMKKGYKPWLGGHHAEEKKKRTALEADIG